MLPTSLKSKSVQKGAIRGTEEDGNGTGLKESINSDWKDMTPFVDIWNEHNIDTQLYGWYWKD